MGNKMTSSKITTNTRNYRTTAVNSNRCSCQKGDLLLERLVIKARAGLSLGNEKTHTYRATNIWAVEEDERQTHNCPYRTRMSLSDCESLVIWVVWKTEKNGSVPGNLRICPETWTWRLLFLGKVGSRYGNTAPIQKGRTYDSPSVTSTVSREF